MTEKIDLLKLRKEIGSIDEKIMALIAQRQEIAKQIGQYKINESLPIIDYRREKLVIESNRKRAKKEGVYLDLAEDISKLLIKYSVMAQEEFHSKKIKAQSSSNKTILIVGGRGLMGRWFANFFHSFGHNILLFDQQARATTKTNQDPNARQTEPLDVSEFAAVDSLKEGADLADIIVIATPILVTIKIYEELLAIKTSALLFDICSLKTPIISQINNAQRAKLKVTSIHPMFGPDVEFLSGRNILICDCGNSEASNAAKELFEETTANIIMLDLERHDQLMGYVLGLSHITNLIFAKALESSGFKYKELLGVASTTFNNQIKVTLPVTKENQSLYFEIQAENKFSQSIIEKLNVGLEDYCKAIANKDSKLFCQLMESSKEYFQND